MSVASATRSLPWSWYTDTAAFELERERVFRRSWQYVGHLDQARDPGAFFAATAGHVPVVVVRGRDGGRDGVLRAFLNVCRHRGSLVCEGEGRRKTLQCPYHAWSYDLDGSLRSAPRSDREPGFDRSALGLVPVAVDTWGPFVFVNPDADAPPLEHHLGELPDLLRTGGLDVDALVFERRTEGDYEANWKVCVENFLECYHCQVAHPSLARAIDVRVEAYRLETRPTFSSQRAIARDGGGGVYEATGELEHGQFHFLFPNTVVNVMPGHPNLSIGPVVPASAERTHRFLDYFFAADVGETWKADFFALDDHVGAEDRVLVERVQQGLGSGLIEHGRLLAESERLIAHFQALLVEALAD